MPGNVSLSTGNVESPLLNKANNKTGSGGGFDASQINSIMSYSSQFMPQEISGVMNNIQGSISDPFGSAINNLCDGLGLSPEVSAAVKGLGEIVKIVLTGQYNTGEDTKDAKNSLENIKNDATVSNNLANVGDEKSKQVISDVNSKTQELGMSIDTAKNEIVVTVDAQTTAVGELNEENLKTADMIVQNQKLIDENNAKITEKQTEQENLKQQIDQRRSELSLEPLQSGKPEEKGEDPYGKTDGVEDSQLKSLMTQYAALGVEIAGYGQMNTALTSQNNEFKNAIMSNVAVAQESIAQTIEVSEQQAEFIDDAANQIMQTCEDGKAAVGEIQKLLQGQFPKIDKVTAIRLATEMTKSAICGTKGGLLASAASAMGVSSIVSFGSTAAKAAELAAASGDQFAASAANIASNVAGKVIEQQMSKYMNQMISQIGNSIGVDLSPIQQLSSELLAETNTEVHTKLDTFKSLQIEVPENVVDLKAPPKNEKDAPVS